MAESFADVTDLEARWRVLAPDEVERAAVLLADASAMVRALVPTVDDRIEAGLLDPVIVTRVVCAVVKRQMLAGDELEGVASETNVAGPFTVQLGYANPTGDAYMTKAELTLLGGGRRQRAFSVEMAGNGS